MWKKCVEAGVSGARGNATNHPGLKATPLWQEGSCVTQALIWRQNMCCRSETCVLFGIKDWKF